MESVYKCRPFPQLLIFFLENQCDLQFKFNIHPEESVPAFTMDFHGPKKTTFELAGQEFPRITWYKQKGMRGLYVCLLFVVLTSATNGYDGSMMNGLQSLPQWESCKHSLSRK